MNHMDTILGRIVRTLNNMPEAKLRLLDKVISRLSNESEYSLELAAILRSKRQTQKPASTSRKKVLYLKLLQDGLGLPETNGSRYFNVENPQLPLMSHYSERHEAQKSMSWAVSIPTGFSRPRLRSEPCNPTGKTTVRMFAVEQGGSAEDILSSLKKPRVELSLTEHQIMVFCEENRRLLSEASSSRYNLFILNQKLIKVWFYREKFRADIITARGLQKLSGGAKHRLFVQS